MQKRKGRQQMGIAGNKKVVILGGGAAAMLAAMEMAEKIHPDNISVIAEKLMFSDSPGLHYLHNVQENRDLLTRLGVSFTVEPVQGAIISKGGGIYPFVGGLCPQDLVDAVQAHHLKTRGVPWSGSVRSMNSIISHNFSGDTLDKLTCKISELTLAIYEATVAKGVHIINGKAEVILPTVKKVQYRTQGVVQEIIYDHIISTMPLRDLLVSYVALDAEVPQIDRWHSAMGYKPVYTRAEAIDRIPESFRQFDFIYSPFNYGWYRASKTSDGNVMYFEFSSEIQARAFKVSSDGVNPYGHIFSECPGLVNDAIAQFKRKRIYCIGRLGRWNSGTLIHQVVTEAQETAEWIAGEIKEEIMNCLGSDQNG